MTSLANARGVALPICADEASVTIDWVGACTGTKTTTHYSYVIAEGVSDVSIRSACRVAFQARAWAYCPAGVAP